MVWVVAWFLLPFFSDQVTNSPNSHMKGSNQGGLERSFLYPENSSNSSFHNHSTVTRNLPGFMHFSPMGYFSAVTVVLNRLQQSTELFDFSKLKRALLIPFIICSREFFCFQGVCGKIEGLKFTLLKPSWLIVWYACSTTIQYLYRPILKDTNFINSAICCVISVPFSTGTVGLEALKDPHWGL